MTAFAPDTTRLRHVFVYGTLRRGGSNDINRLAPAPQWRGPARIAGTLYDLGAYPGVVLGGPGWVRGEVYTIAAELECQLDEIEGVWPQPNGEYTRREIDVALDHAPAGWLRCLVYEVNAAWLQGRRTLPSGDWMAEGARNPTMQKDKR